MIPSVEWRRGTRKQHFNSRKSDQHIADDPLFFPGDCRSGEHGVKGNIETGSVKTLKWTNKIFNREKDNLEDIFGNHSPEKENHYKQKKIRKSFTLPIIFILQIIDPTHAKYLFQDKNCAKKEHAIFRT